MDDSVERSYYEPTSARMKDVSAFIVGTSPVHPKLYSDVFYSMQFHIVSPKQQIQLHFGCGSAIEFYVEPINSCIGDTDILVSTVNDMAFIDNIPVLPDDVSGLLDTINCLQIAPYPDHPGFVKLRGMGKMRYNWNSKKFEFQQTCLPVHFAQIFVVHYTSSPEHIAEQEHYCTGTAYKFLQYNTLPSDFVYCFWCPQWPDEAMHWPSRRRQHEWLTIANIRKIVQSGCHVVHAKDPACRNDVLQCRLSFSVAEVILLQSWTPVQQIVYHMLRFFAKRELIKKDCPKEDEVLSTYHFKTLILWSCEEMSLEWWNSTSVIEICCILLRKLSEWLQKRYCPNYFIPRANLFHEQMNKKIVYETTRRLNELCHSDNLTGWFADKYVRPAFEKGSIITNTRDLMTDFDECILRNCEIMDRRKLGFFDLEFTVVFYDCVEYTAKEVIRQKSYAYGNYLQCFHGTIKILQKTLDLGKSLSTVEFSSSFPQFVKVLFSLHVANALGYQKMTYESSIITEFVREVSWQSKVLKSKHHNFPKPNSASLDRSFVLFLTSQGLMENLTGTISPLEFKLVSQLSKGLLGKALQCEDSKSKTIASATLAYMAALHFAASEYQTATDLCYRVIINASSPDEKEKETLNAGCLLYNEDIAIITGFYLLFRQIKYGFHYNKRLHLLDLRITPEVFAMHLINSSKVKRPKNYRLLYDMQIATFPLDEFLMTMTNWKSGISKRAESVLLVYQRSDPIKELGAFNKSCLLNEEGIIQLLMDYSLENMTTFYNAICKDFGIRCNTTDCYRAAHLGPIQVS